MHALYFLFGERLTPGWHHCVESTECDRDSLQSDRWSPLPHLGALPFFFEEPPDAPALALAAIAAGGGPWGMGSSV